MTVWTWVIGGTPPLGIRTRELTLARGRTVTWRLDGPCTAQFTINGRSDEAAQIVELETDLTIFRDGHKMFRGRIGPSTDDIGPGSHVSQFTAIDYRGMLNYRKIGRYGASYTATPAGTIAADLVAASQALPGGNWGITAGVGAATGTVRDNTLDPGKPIDEAIAEMGRLDNGYEWDVDADLALNLWHPTRGDNNGVVLDYGGLLNRVRRQLDPKDYANATLATGATGLTPATDETSDVATDPKGRLEVAVGYPSIINQPYLDAKAAWLLGQTSTLRAGWSVTFRPGRWGGRGHVWLGDTCTLVVPSGRLTGRVVPVRVAEISVQPGDDGTETVTAGVLAA